MSDLTKSNKGKSIASFAKNPKFRDLTTTIRGCQKCKDRKQKISDSIKLLPKITLKASDSFWKNSKGRK